MRVIIRVLFVVVLAVISFLSMQQFIDTGNFLNLLAGVACGLAAGWNLAASISGN